MTSTTKFAVGVIATIVVAGGVFGGYKYLFAPTQAPLPPAGASPTGSTFNTAKFYGITMNLATPGANGTSSSILNNDSNDRKIVGWVNDCGNVGSSKIAYTGGGLDSLRLTFGTTTTANPPSITNVNVQTLNIGTITPDSYNEVGLTSTTTPTGLLRTWLAGSYLTITTNATNTAVCTVGVYTIGS